MKIDKNYSLYSIELQYGKRWLEYNSHLWLARYRYNLKEKEVPITVERYWKALQKYHKSKYGEYIAPTIYTESLESEVSE